MMRELGGLVGRDIEDRILEWGMVVCCVRASVKQHLQAVIEQFGIIIVKAIIPSSYRRFPFTVPSQIVLRP